MCLYSSVDICKAAIVVFWCVVFWCIVSSGAYLGVCEAVLLIVCTVVF